MREKLAALGELTAGVAHEIRNPLNFVKNFSEGSVELIDELREVMEEGTDTLTKEQRQLIEDVLTDLSDNLTRIRSHGDRADRIVHDMLMMGRGSGELQATDINRLIDEHARLAYHSARATDPNFQLDLQQDFDPNVGELDVVPQDLGRVFLNMVSNACYATNQKRRAAIEAGDEASYSPTLLLSTQRDDDQIEIRVRDNGSGIPSDAIDKIFNPFFTTKPTDQGTGLGLAISNDIVRQHGGSVRVETEPGEFTEMIVQIPHDAPSGLAKARVSNRRRALRISRSPRIEPATRPHYTESALDGTRPPCYPLVPNALTGAIPSELGDLSDLTALGLQINQLSGIIPSELGDLSATASGETQINLS